MWHKLKKLVVCVLLPAVLTVLMLPAVAFAQEETCTVSIPAEVRIKGSRIPKDVPYRLMLEPVTEAAPMPDIEELIIVDGGKKLFEPITYTEPGNYKYRVYQNSDPRPRFTYDDTVYLVTVRITNGENGGFDTQVWAADSELEAEKKEIVFINTYKPSGGGGGGGTAPDPDPGPSPQPNPGPTPGPSPQPNPSPAPEPGGGTAPSGDGLTEIVDEPTPLGGLITIPDGTVPLAGLPKTGDTRNLSFWILLAVISGCGLAVLAGLRKRMDL